MRVCALAFLSCSNQAGRLPITVSSGTTAFRHLSSTANAFSISTLSQSRASWQTACRRSCMIGGTRRESGS